MIIRNCSYKQNKPVLSALFWKNSRISLYILPFQALYWKKQSESRNAYVWRSSSFLCMRRTHTRFSQTMRLFFYRRKSNIRLIFVSFSCDVSQMRYIVKQSVATVRNKSMSHCNNRWRKNKREQIIRITNL